MTAPRYLKEDVFNGSRTDTGRKGLSVESVFRCMLLKQMLNVSCDKLVLHLSDSQSFRTFARLEPSQHPTKTCLSINIRRIQPATLEKVFNSLVKKGFDCGSIDIGSIRIDSSVVKSNIVSPSDSQLLNDGIRVLSRLLAKSKDETGYAVNFVDHRKAARTLAFRIFNTKKVEKDRLYPELLMLARKVIKQVESAIITVEEYPFAGIYTDYWLANIQHYQELLLQVIDQTERRVLQGEHVSANDKIVSLFEEHTDIIVKGHRDIEYGHKINVASEKNGFLTHVAIEKGNPADADRFIPIIDAHRECLGCLPNATVADGCYASQENVSVAREQGIARVVFNKKRGLSLTAMGVKQKTFNALKDFRAGIEGNISEIKRVFGLTRAAWKGFDGFKSYVWASAIAYNLVRLARFEVG